jgi:hypothetical protein
MNQRIRIIKSAERKRQAAVRTAKKRRASADRIGLVPDAATTVRGWVGESRQLKRQNTEATHSLKSLFGDTE